MRIQMTADVLGGKKKQQDWLMRDSGLKIKAEMKGCRKEEEEKEENARRRERTNAND